MKVMDVKTKELNEKATKAKNEQRKNKVQIILAAASQKSRNYLHSSNGGAH